MPYSRMLELAHERLYWPEPSQIWHPSGSGPKIYAQLTREKIGKKIKRDFPEVASGLEVSVLAANPEGDETEAPIAIICQFNRPIPQTVIRGYLEIRRSQIKLRLTSVTSIESSRCE